VRLQTAWLVLSPRRHASRVVLPPDPSCLRCPALPCPAAKLDDAGKRQRSELEDRITCLQELQKSYEDPGACQHATRCCGAWQRRALAWLAEAALAPALVWRHA